jgi:hypothetical protein
MVLLTSWPFCKDSCESPHVTTWIVERGSAWILD